MIGISRAEPGRFYHMPPTGQSGEAGRFVAVFQRALLARLRPLPVGVVSEGEDLLNARGAAAALVE